MKKLFTRNLSRQLENELLKSNLFNKKLKKDNLNQEVFLTIRNNYIDFYHKGGRLFKFDNSGYHTHIKYAAVIEKIKKDYLTQSELGRFKIASNFDTHYKRIKENCANYSGVEALGVSELYRNYSYLNTNSEIVVLDIEVSFQSLENKKELDRIDILLLNKKTKLLQFIEAKHYSNSEIWSNTTPKVVKQIRRYEKRIQSKRDEILSEYARYINKINIIFKVTLPNPINIDKQVTLLIFGFDNDQKNGRLKKLITNNKKYLGGIKNYNIGNIDQIVIENLWNAKTI